MPSAPSYDEQRRFGGLDRLFGDAGVTRLRAAHVAVAGIGGVGSWCAEALARSGVGQLSLIDLDHVSESNINRQLHALTDTLGQSKVIAMAQRVRGINPGCRVNMLDDFIGPDNVETMVAPDVDVVIDCTDQALAKTAMILEAARRRRPIVVCGGAGGKTDPLKLRAGDLALATNDALLAKLRNVLRRQHRYPKASDAAGKRRRRVPKMGVRALWFDQPAVLPELWQSRPAPAVVPQADGAAMAPQGLSCAGYGSLVTVTAAMGLVAANEALQWLLTGRFPE